MLYTPRGGAKDWVSSMKTLQVGKAKLSITDGNILLFEVDEGFVVDKKAAKEFYSEIENHVTGDYSLIISRKNKYQLLRFEVFDVINTQSRLIGLAIVAVKASARKMAEIEAPLCQKPFAIFSNIKEAVAWLEIIHQNNSI